MASHRYRVFLSHSSVGDFLSEGGQARTVSAVDAEAVGGAELLLLQRLASASRAALAVQSVRAVHWSGTVREKVPNIDTAGEFHLPSRLAVAGRSRADASRPGAYTGLPLATRTLMSLHPRPAG